MKTYWNWLLRFSPEPIVVNHTERLRACLGALIGILLTGLLTYAIEGGSSAVPLLVAPIGASAVLLFAVPSSPLAQPWSIVGGNMIAAIIGVTCALWIHDLILAAALAVSISIAAMFALRCLHPPSGAVALTAVLGGSAIHAQGYSFVFFPIGINSLLLLLVAIVFNNLTRRPYPHATKPKTVDSHLTADIPPEQRFGFTSDDLNDVLKQYNQVLDISREDLQSLFVQTEMHAYRRRLGEITCKDIMSRDVIKVEFGTTLEDAWALLRKHDIKALPVVDRVNRVIGIVTQIDFMKHANLEVYENFASKLRRFIQRTTTINSDKPEVVGQIMTSAVISANTDMHIIGLIPLMSQHGLHHIPVINEDRRLVGIVTQSDLVAALYHGNIDSGRADSRLLSKS
ncbi:MAG TPA: HPP family protein [Methylotenera sp.]|nr:HPP family protein [Methylotenera sp.]